MTYLAKTPCWLKKAYPKDYIWEMPATREPEVYITFDDGPHPTATPFVLHQLSQFDAKATFFCVGHNVVKFPDVFSSVVDQGHAVANHTFNHLNGWKTTTEAYLENIEKAAREIPGRLFRPPYGKIRPSQSRRLRKLHPDWKVIMWDVLSADFDRDLTPAQCLANVLPNIRPGSIVLFHDSEKAWDRMHIALPAVLAHCRDKGWKMKAIPY